MIEGGLEQEVNEVFHITVTSVDNSEIALHQLVDYYCNKWVKFRGTPGSTGDILWNSEQQRNRDIIQG